MIMPSMQRNPSTAVHHSLYHREILVVDSHNACDLTDTCAHNTVELV